MSKVVVAVVVSGLATALLLLLSAPPPATGAIKMVQRMQSALFSADQDNNNKNDRRYEWVARIGLDEHNDEFLCSGFVVGKLHVVTARSCVERHSLESLTVEVGFSREEEGGEEEEEQHNVVHVRERHDQGDLTLLVLEQAVHVKPAVPHLESKMDFLLRTTTTTEKKKGHGLLQLISAGCAASKKDSGNHSSFRVRSLPVKYESPEKCATHSSPSLLSSSESSSWLPSILCSTPKKKKKKQFAPCAKDIGAAVVLAADDSGLEKNEKKKKKKPLLDGRADVVVAVHIAGPSLSGDVAVSSLEGEEEEDLLRHYPLFHGANLLTRVICENDTTAPEDWCPPRQLRASVVRRWTGHTDSIAVGELSFGPTDGGGLLLSSSRDGTTKVWNPLSGKKALATFADRGAAQFHPFLPLVASANENVLYIRAYSDKKAKNDTPFWATMTKKAKENDQPLFRLHGHDGLVTAVAWSPCGTRLASGSVDGTVKIWSLPMLSQEEEEEEEGDEDESPTPPHLLATLTEHQDWISSVAFSPEGRQLASASFDHSIILWDATSDSFQRLQTLTGHSDWVHHVAYSPNGKWLASGSADGSAKVWDSTTGKLQLPLREHSASVRVVTWNPRHVVVLATGSWDGTVRIWDVEAAIATAERQRRQKEEEEAPSSILVFQDGDGGQAAPVHGLDWSPDGTSLAAGYQGTGEIILWNITKQHAEDDKEDRQEENTMVSSRLLL